MKTQDVCLFVVVSLKQFNSKTRDGFTVNSKVPSTRDPGKEYDGFTITITGDRYGPDPKPAGNLATGAFGAIYALDC